MPQNHTVAVLGAGGTMGFPMARNLVRAGLGVRAWDRSRDKAAPLEAEGARVCDSPADALTEADVVLTMLRDADAVLEAVRQALTAEPPAGTIWLQMSTIGEEGTERCIELAREHKLEFVDAPVLGTKQPAEEGKLLIMASGPDQLRDQVQPIFEPLGQRSMWVGPAGHGSLLKLATNSWLVAVVEGAAETLAFADGLGLDPQLVLEAIAGGPLDSPYLQMKGKAMIEHSFEPSFKLELAAKDAMLVEQSAVRHELDLPLLRTVRQRLAEGAEQHGDQDISAVFLISARSGAGPT